MYPLAEMVGRTETKVNVAAARLLQPCVLRLGLLQDGDVGVSVFPEGEEVLVHNFRLRSVTYQRVGASELDMG
jgi:hypothetical protein